MYYSIWPPIEFWWNPRRNWMCKGFSSISSIRLDLKTGAKQHCNVGWGDTSFWKIIFNIFSPFLTPLELCIPPIGLIPLQIHQNLSPFMNYTAYEFWSGWDSKGKKMQICLFLFQSRKNTKNFNLSHHITLIHHTTQSTKPIYLILYFYSVKVPPMHRY